MFRSIIVIFSLSGTLLLVSCDPKSGNGDTTKDTLAKAEEKERKYYSGEADRPANEFQITSAGLGNLLLGDSLEKVLATLQPQTTKVEDKGYFEDGKEWPSKKITLQNGYYISVAMVNTIDLVTTIHTNDPSFTTKSNIHAGLLMDSLSVPLDSIKSDYEHRSFTFGQEGVWFKINKKAEETYFKSDNPSHDLLKGARIEEMYIVCGDC